jgi:hypothetical protein
MPIRRSNGRQTEISAPPHALAKIGIFLAQHTHSTYKNRYIFLTFIDLLSPIKDTPVEQKSLRDFVE